MRTDRIRTLAAFLDTLLPEKFDFNEVYEETGCGTVGCAMGWSPVVFPALIHRPQARERQHLFQMGAKADSHVGYHREHSYAEAAALLFDLPYSAAVGLFTPGCATPDGQPPLLCCASPKEVADRLHKFADWADAQKGTTDASTPAH